MGQSPLQTAASDGTGSASIAPLPPGSWLGLMGGGQLGRMFAASAQALGYRVLVLEPAAESPAGCVADDQVIAAYDDPQGLQQLASRCAAATTEFENVPAASLDFLARHVPVSPAGSAVAIAQDRSVEKRFVAQLGIAVAPFAVIESAEDVAAADGSLFPGILKVSRLGYDGKGQARVRSRDEALAAFDAFGRVPCVLEKMLDLRAEVSVVLARGRDGAVQVFPVQENVHRDGILALTAVPARVSDALAQAARDAACSIAQALGYVGVLCVEFFVVADDAQPGQLRLVVNEMAPRPHNSGHYSIDACVSSQFEQQARAMAGMPLGDASQLAPAVMLNLLGDLWYPSADSDEQREPDWAAVLSEPKAKLHLYGKTQARRARKMGHVTVLGASLTDALARARRVELALGVAEQDSVVLPFWSSEPASA